MEKDISKTHLYFIRDRLSGLPETAIIQSANDAVACRGFQEFLKHNDEAREAQKLPLIGRIERELVHVCALDENNHVLIPECDRANPTSLSDLDYRVVCNGETVDNILEEFTNGLRG